MFLDGGRGGGVSGGEEEEAVCTPEGELSEPIIGSLSVTYSVQRLPLEQLL